MNTIAGAACLARLNSCFIAFSDSPTYLESNSGPFMAMKFKLLSVATALASSVLEHPGGPYNKTWMVSKVGFQYVIYPFMT